MKLSTEAVSLATARHPWRVMAIWGLLLVLATTTIVLLLGNALTTEQRVTNNPESYRAAALLADRFPRSDEADEIVVVRSASRTVDDPAFERFVVGLYERLRASRAIARGTHYYGPQKDGSLVSADRHATIVPIVMGDKPDEKIVEVIEIVQRAGGDGFEVTISGTYTLDRDFTELSQRDLKEGELFFGLPAALIILVLVFGAVVAGLVPILMALASIVVALALVALVGQAFELSFFVVNMLSGMGLALGIDYSLFVISRYREERHRGRDKLDAIEASGATATRAVFFSGIAFVVALLGMLLVPDTIMRSLALGAILVGLVSVAAAVSLLPALLSLLGDRIDSLRVPLIGRTVAAGSDREGRFWSWASGAVMRRPAASLVLSAGLLLAAAVPVLDLETGFPGVSTLPDSFVSKQGFVALERDFRSGSTDPAQVVVQGAVSSTPVQAAIGRLERRLRSNETFGPARLVVSRARDLAVLSIPLAGDPSGERAVSAVRELRREHIPAAFAGVEAEVLVGGETAEEVDYFALIDRWLPIVFAFVLGLSFVLLTIVFRSIVVPLKAIVLNLLSVGAAYGLLVLVFQKGVGADALGLQQAETITAWVPLFLFSVLFGLSMDYHVFLLTRIRERYWRTGDNSDAVVHSVASTARLITGAALIIIAVFTGFATGEMVMFQQMGFGIAVALLIDATIIRSVLLPASMHLLGKRNWYLPSWLRWLPELQVEKAPAQT